MSVTVVALPATIAWALNTLLAVSATAGIADALKKEKNQQSEIKEICEDIHIISEVNFMEKSLETPFMDKNILLKTLEEHGVQNIKDEFGKIQGEYDSYSFTFEKNEVDKPYFLTIKYLEKDNIEEKMNDLSSEYALNVQEDAYLGIVEKLKENNMEIEEEEVLDDNTIVLTVNLEG